MMAAVEDFPLSALLPKNETQVEQFIKKFPEYNGDDILIAIFDSGVDPGAPGLQKLPSGDRKIIDIIDCSGAGDVDTSTVVKASDEGVIQGISGKQLKIPATWVNPSNNYHVGIKDSFSLLPSPVLRRVQKERKEEDWDPMHKLKLANASRMLADYESKHPQSVTEEEKLTHENLKQLVESLKMLDQKFVDVGPLYDCVVFNDGERWRACIDTTGSGNLEQCKLLGTFKETGEFSRLSQQDMMNYSVNIYDDGNILSIVTTSSAHGTHVASIAGAYFEEEPKLNGVAPGAKLISMQIGDNRVDGMETGAAMIRAVKCAIDSNVDVINMSYGEATKFPDRGRVIESMNKMVKEHNILFLSSAGNDGPALSTVGCPGPTSEDVIGIGAYISPDMMTAEYSVLEKMPATLYHWSSRGPCVDGSLGVSVCAPGGAITSIPNWTLSKSQLMNGTSMSSPNAAGAVAVLLSALKKQNIAYSPRSIQRALENTALKIPDTSHFSQGYGLIQVEEAFNFVQELSKIDKFHDQLHFQVTCNGRKGIYIRDQVHHNAPSKYTITVKPLFNKKTDNNLKITFNINTRLVTSATWVKSPTHLDICNSARSFPITVQTDGLQPGCHYAEIEGFDVNQPNVGPVFKFPITVIIPEIVEDSTDEVNMNLAFNSADIIRKFFLIPSQAVWASIKLIPKECELDVRYYIHALYLEEDSGFSEHDHRINLNVKANSNNTKNSAFKVNGGKTLEIAFARSWASQQDETELDVTLKFHGLQPNRDSLTLIRSEVFTSVTIRNNIGFEQIHPSCNLTHRVVPLSPKESVIVPLGERDKLPNNEQIYNTILTYQFNLVKESEVMMIAPLFHDLLYENKYESQMCLIYDSNKALCGKSDALPHKNRYISKLAKGDYTVMFQVRHSNLESLEILKDMVLEAHITLATPIPLDMYNSRLSLIDKTKFKSITLSPHQQCKVYVTVPTDDKYPKQFKLGDRLVGNITYTNSSVAKTKVCYPITLVNNVTATKAKDKKDTGKSKEDEYKDALDQFLVSWITKIDNTEVQQEIFNTSSKSLTCLDGQLNVLDSSKDRKEKLSDIVQMSQNILSKIDEKDLLSYIGTKVDSTDECNVNKVKMDKCKSIYINCNHKLGMAASELLQDVTNPLDAAKREELLAALNESYRNLLKVVDGKDGKLLLLTVQHGIVHKQYGRSLKAMLKYFDENVHSKDNYQTFLSLLDSCELSGMIEFFGNTELMKFPTNYQLF